MSTNKIGFNGSSKMINENRLKQEAKNLKKQQNLKHHEALQQVAQKYGFYSWQQVLDELAHQASLGIVEPAIPTIVNEIYTLENKIQYDIHYEQDGNSDAQLIFNARIRANMVVLTQLGVEFSMFEPTVTGLKKSILDATQPVRQHFVDESYHNYQIQDQGPEYKVLTDGYFVNKELIQLTKVSLYRPKTKKGDPRMWFRKLSEFADAGDQIAIIILDNKPHLLNLSQDNLENELRDPQSEIAKLLHDYVEQNERIVKELLAKLYQLAKTPFKAQREGDTAIGYTIESLLGIAANSSKAPDYKGIEIKSGRGNKTRTTLFAQVADWDLSPCGVKSKLFERGSSNKILDRYGYDREGELKLYCTVSAQKENTQGLHFIYNKKNDQLEEWHAHRDLVAVWPGQLLRSRLLEKHRETLWIEAESFFNQGEEYFQLIAVTHTKAPIVNQLLPLISAGVITMDHLIKRVIQTGKVSEKGPLFKMNKKDLELLFPDPKVYSLQIFD